MTCKAAVERATGATGNPMPDSAIESKLLAEAEPAIGDERGGEERGLVRRLEKAKGFMLNNSALRLSVRTPTKKKAGGMIGLCFGR